MKLIQKARFGAFLPILFILFFGVVGCKSTDDGRYSYRVIEGEKVKFVDGDDLVPPMPDSDLNDESLAGVDSDGDGVRDDVENWINENGENTAIRISLKIIARNLSLAIVNHKEERLVIEYTKKITQGEDCISELLGLDFMEANKLKETIYSEIVNTRMREKAYVFMDRSLSGQAFGLNFENACEVIGVKIK